MHGKKGLDYRGCQNETINGHRCKRWDKTSVKKSTHYKVAGTEGNNFCRNPRAKAGGIWCYTGDEEWEHCVPIDYEKMEEGSLCTAPHVGITTEEECMKAAGHLNLPYHKAKSGNKVKSLEDAGNSALPPRGCFYDARDGSAPTVSFLSEKNGEGMSISQLQNGDGVVNKQFAGICTYKVTVTGKRCVLPFTYKSETFTNCVPSATWPSSSWCSTGNDPDGNYADWDYCAKGGSESFASAPSLSFGCLILFSLFA